MSNLMTNWAILKGQRVMVKPGEAIRFPDGVTPYAELCVREGRAWLTLDNVDVILAPGERWIVRPSKSPLVVTALGGALLQLEVLS